MKKGNLIFWEIDGLKVTPSELVAAGLGDYVPRNDYRSALIKALNLHVKSDSTKRLKQKFDDAGDTASWSIFVKDDAARDVSREMTINLNKVSGRIDFAGGTEAIQEAITQLYKDEQGTINTVQFRAMLINAVRSRLHGIPMKRSGGIYFIDNRFEKEREWLAGIFTKFPQIKLMAMPVYDDQGTLDAIAEGAKFDIFSDIESLINDVENKFKEGTITKRTLASRKEEAVKILEKIEIHRENLSVEIGAVTERLTKVRGALEAVTTKVEDGVIDPEDFLAELAKL